MSNYDNVRDLRNVHDYVTLRCYAYEFSYFSNFMTFNYHEKWHIFVQARKVSWRKKM